MEAIVYKNNIKLLICYNQNYNVGNQWMDGLMDQLDGWIDGWIDQCIDRLIDKSMDRPING